MSGDVTLLTREGYEKLQKELEYLKTTRREEVAEKIRVARGFGDLSENAEYDAAKDEQAEIEARIYTIENQLKNCQIIDEQSGEKEKNLVSIGSTIRVEDLELQDVRDVTLVGTVEADPKKGKISNVSPVGQAVIGRKAGETVEVTTPMGVLKFKIHEILQ